jgi:hypothetical protein
LRAISSVSTYSAMVCSPGSSDAVDRLHQRVVEVVLRDALHEQAVDLDAVHREMLEVVERRQAAAEVVEQEAHAHARAALSISVRARSTLAMAAVSVISKRWTAAARRLGELLLHELGEVGLESVWPERLMENSAGAASSRSLARRR